MNSASSLASALPFLRADDSQLWIPVADDGENLVVVGDAAADEQASASELFGYFLMRDERPPRFLPSSA